MAGIDAPTWSNLAHLIDGRAVTSTSTFEVVDPALGEVFATCPSCTRAEADRALSSAASALRSWGESEEARRAVLLTSADRIEQAADLLISVLCRETGKPLSSAAFEVHGVVAHLRHYAEAPIPLEIIHDDETQHVSLVRRPIGVVVAITPWNGPLVMLANKIGAALLVGNTVVAKPSPFTPLSSLLIGALLRDIVPAGVLNIVAGGDELGRYLVSHPDTAMISFTGSVRAGMQIMESAAASLKRICLELGGNDAAIVLEDADVDAIAPLLFRGAFALTGQICAAIKRLYVHESIYESLVAQLSQLALEARPGAPGEAGVTMGPLTTRPQYERVCELVEDALAHGGKAVTGGEPLERPGFFYPPTIVTGVARGTRVVDEEQFGPVLPVMAFSDDDAVIAEANATAYGLGGSIWTSDLERGAELAGRLRCGTAWVNRHPVVGPDLPFGGFKQSGFGRENGAVGIDHYSELQTLSIARA